MAYRPIQHKIGNSGEKKLQSLINDLGFATSEISPDYGEDFFIFGEDNGLIEPFKIYVQVKTSDNYDKHASDWTIYEDPLTVRNWVIGNDFTVLVRYNRISQSIKYCIPEDDVNYWDIPVEDNTNVPLHCSTTWEDQSIHEIMWKARIRHYDRMFRITQPNNFEDIQWNEIHQFKLFCFEFLTRLGFIDEKEVYLKDDIYTVQLRLTIEMLEDYEDSDDMSAFDKSRYAACVLIILVELQKRSGVKVGMRPYFVDGCASLLVQFIHARTAIELGENFENEQLKAAFRFKDRRGQP